MELNKFKKLYKRFSNFPLSKKETDSEDYYIFHDALTNDSFCEQWYLKQILKERRFDYKSHCCLEMAYHLSAKNEKGTLKDDPDIIVEYNKKRKTYGIPIHDGSSSWIAIKHCPWCGRNLKSSKK